MINHTNDCFKNHSYPISIIFYKILHISHFTLLLKMPTFKVSKIRSCPKFYERWKRRKIIFICVFRVFLHFLILDVLYNYRDHILYGKMASAAFRYLLKWFRTIHMLSTVHKFLVSIFHLWRFLCDFRKINILTTLKKRITLNRMP